MKGGKAVEMADSIQEALKDYEISKVIGKGSFGTVFKAKKVGTNERVALKVLQNITHSANVARSVLREVSTLV